MKHPLPPNSTGSNILGLLMRVSCVEGHRILNVRGKGLGH